MKKVLVGFWDVGMVGSGFTFLLPDELENAIDGEYVGQMVYAPLGGVKKRGIILGIDNSEADMLRMEKVVGIATHPFGKLLTKATAEIILWMSAYYLSPLQKVIRLFIPEKIWSGSFKPNIAYRYCLNSELPLIPKRARGLLLVVEKLDKKGWVTEEEALKVISKAILKKAIEMQIVIPEQTGFIAPKPYLEEQGERIEKMLTIEQKEICEKLNDNREAKFLLHGVTGSGKTEIYLSLAKKMAEEGKQSIVLVPEIALTPQLFSYFSKEFGAKVALFHSGLSQGERHTEWLRVRAGEVDIILGSRSALFAPVKKLGMIVIDEEHEWTYKNEQNPRYMTRTVALEMHKQRKRQEEPFLLLLGSATPSIETMYLAREEGVYELLTLTKKIFEQERNTEYRIRNTAG